MKERLIQYKRSFSFVGLMLATLFFAASVTPSLLPRTYLVQGILSGFALAIGYSIGVVLVWMYQFFELRKPTGRTQVIAKRITTAVVVVLFIGFIWRMTFWQNSIRQLMGIEDLETTYPYRTAAIAIVFGAILVAFARLFVAASAFVARKLNRVFPEKVAKLVAFISVGLLVMFLTNDVVAKSLLSAADSFFANLDELSDDDVQRPDDNSLTGGEDSLVDWDSIGRQGKIFLALGPTQTEITEFTGVEAQRPIRVYVGVRSRPTMRDRAKLALEELKRVGGFDKSVLIVATPTGTGWLDPSAVDTVEYLHGGDTAIVSTQYSYLPSWITILVDPQRSIDSAKALFDEVYGYWKTLPKDSRPRLYLQGLSLGSLGSEESADLFTIFEDPIDGALWSGPPFPSKEWNASVRNRNEGSPAWLPTFRDGRLLRFTAQENSLQPEKQWGKMRNVYIQYSSDPMVWFSPSLAWSRPEWLTSPPGPDVSPHLRWYPIITFLQIGFDLPMATTVPIGHGHNYSPSSYIDGWVAVTEPEHASPVQVASLKEIFRLKAAPKP
ncbi:hypothetical protein Pla22_05990 [Rubripirellula amarantea]|uniref:Alpha/beta-hydrolase family protein n=1 Tax=Rubripirellula amarantea TaxID=2527999 RepID=A0A5C5WS33_9BACT|nr:alpha/beta-hydrolase family protein [Rubripirellula amarantea]TWT52971.1 hypothetical protein Pla22_05990 [Rubripirellula amarantea]